MKITPAKTLCILIVVCFALIEFPGIYFINRIEPTLFNVPFIYWFPFLVWAVLCALLFIGYKLGWKINKH